MSWRMQIVHVGSIAEADFSAISTSPALHQETLLLVPQDPTLCPQRTRVVGGMLWASSILSSVEVEFADLGPNGAFFDEFEVDVPVGGVHAGLLRGWLTDYGHARLVTRVALKVGNVVGADDVASFYDQVALS